MVGVGAAVYQWVRRRTVEQLKDKSYGAYLRHVTDAEARMRSQATDGGLTSEQIAAECEELRKRFLEVLDAAYQPSEELLRKWMQTGKIRAADAQYIRSIRLKP